MSLLQFLCLFTFSLHLWPTDDLPYYQPALRDLSQPDLPRSSGEDLVCGRRRRPADHEEQGFRLGREISRRIAATLLLPTSVHRGSLRRLLFPRSGANLALSLPLPEPCAGGRRAEAQGRRVCYTRAVLCLNEIHLVIPSPSLSSLKCLAGTSTAWGVNQPMCHGREQYENLCKKRRPPPTMSRYAGHSVRGLWTPLPCFTWLCRSRLSHPSCLSVLLLRQALRSHCMAWPKLV